MTSYDKSKVYDVPSCTQYIYIQYIQLCIIEVSNVVNGLGSFCMCVCAHSQHGQVCI